MSFLIKTKSEIDLISHSCDILSRCYGELAKHINVGVSLLELDKIAEDVIRSLGGKPACKNYYGFPATLCLSVNNVVVHGIPNEYKLRDGDILSVDSGVVYKGYYSDSAFTFPIGNVSEEASNLLKVTREALDIGIEQAVLGNKIGDIGYFINKHVQENGYSVVRSFSGHGLGKNFHEDPSVFNYGRRGSGALLRDGMVLAIEPMVNAGNYGVTTLKDGWTTVTNDGSLSAHYEHTVLISQSGPIKLTTFDYID